MIVNRQNKFSFFLLVDDCAFPKVNGDTGDDIPLLAYETLLRLAQTFELCIPLCFTMGYLDLAGRWPESTPLSYAKQLVDLVKKNPQHLMFCDHGLTHKFKATTYEFFNPATGETMLGDEQQKRVATITQIWSDLDLPFPDIMVPPAHGWAPGITDRLYAEAGCRYIVSLPHTKNPLRIKELLSSAGIKKSFAPGYQWPEQSQYLTLLPRSSIWLRHDHLNPSGWILQKMVRSLIQPCSGPFAALYNRGYNPYPVHSYMTHIGNFVGSDAFAFWSKILKWVKTHPAITLARNFDEALQLYDKVATKKAVKLLP
jgi:hypothetical protein